MIKLEHGKRTYGSRLRERRSAPVRRRQNNIRIRRKNEITRTTYPENWEVKTFTTHPGPAQRQTTYHSAQHRRWNANWLVKGLTIAPGRPDTCWHPPYATAATTTTTTATIVIILKTWKRADLMGHQSMSPRPITAIKNGAVSCSGKARTCPPFKVSDNRQADR